MTRRRSSYVRRGRALAVLAGLAWMALPACHGGSSAEAPDDGPPRFDPGPYIAAEGGADRFTLASGGQVAPLLVGADDHAGVIRAVNDLQADLGRVTGVAPSVSVGATPPPGGEIVLVGTIGKSALVDGLVQSGKLDVKGIRGRWESFVLTVVANPLPGVDRALVIAGSDKRGTIYGVYDLSRAIGVSPWYYWADAPAPSRPELFVLPGRFGEGEPAVKYRGIFINDENPSLFGWANEKQGGFNHQLYEKVFELLLRLKANYLWPAQWGKAFNDDDPANPQLADEYGIVMGTSHIEPMMRAEDEWRRYGSGDWNFDTNAAVLEDYWTKGIARMGSYESIVTVGMRGDGDASLTAQTDIPLLERIMDAQRTILADAFGGDPAKVPQVWQLYKEVQDYYDMGMRVPDDVTLMFADDDFGNIRKLPRLSDPARAGGYGLYYHFDFVGGPASYKWLNTVPLAKIWEQLHLAVSYGVDRMWVMNVGDIKPMELPLSFAMDYARDPSRWPVESLPDYARLWAAEQFGGEQADAIGDILSAYTKYNGRRKPDVLLPTTYSLVSYGEAETVVSAYNALADQAQAIYDQLPAAQQDAYYELVLYPVKACANLNDLYVTVGNNQRYATQGRAAANDLAARAQQLFDLDAQLSSYYNQTLAGGKWDHMMDQPHITSLDEQDATANTMPTVLQITVPDGADMGVAIEGSAAWWPNATAPAVLPELNPYQQQQTRYLEVFNRGLGSFEYQASAPVPWLTITPAEGTIDKEARLSVGVDWPQAPMGTQLMVPITVTGPGGASVVIQALVNNPDPADLGAPGAFFESDGYVSIEAEHYTRAVSGSAGATPVGWQRVPDLGRTSSGMTPFPVTADSQTPGGDSPRLEYLVHLTTSGPVQVQAYLSPSLNFHGAGLRYGISFDDETPQIVDMHASTAEYLWESWVEENVNVQSSQHTIDAAGDHVLKLWIVRPGRGGTKAGGADRDRAPELPRPAGELPAGPPRPLNGARKEQPQLA
jgi:hypothetical protein